MRRGELEHLIRAAASIADDDELIIIGSQAILGQHPDAPDDLCVSNEVDLYPKHHPDRADLIDGSIGEGSLFHETFGYYAQGVGDTTAVLAPGWELRLIPVFSPATRGATGWCLETHDLVLAKLIAGREKDLHFAEVAATAKLVRVPELLERLGQMSLDPRIRAAVEARVQRLS